MTTDGPRTVTLKDVAKAAGVHVSTASRALDPSKSWRISPETIAKFGTDWLGLTLPFPLYGIFRYLYLVHKKDGGGSPAEMLLADRPLLACVALWASAAAIIIYGPRLNPFGG